ncbi:hypothetical protein [Brassicibacter mesophilus]|uniref:hypothetical protein n=1 Tax=Brassicibacter mesophilus TaxID=745119 RepID=UPI003D21E2BA
MKYLLIFFTHYIVGYLFAVFSSMIFGTSDDLLFFSILYLSGVIGFWGYKIYQEISKNNKDCS